MGFIQKTRAFFLHVLRTPHFRVKFTWTFIHAAWLLVLTILLQYIPATRSDEMDFLKWAAIWKHNIFLLDTKPEKDNVVFIDVSHDISLIQDKALKYDSAPPFKGPEKVITDRRKLGELFRIINQHPEDYKYILCDILFENPSPDDIYLKDEIEKMKRLMATSVLDKITSIPVRPGFKISYGIVNYTPLQKTMFYKMPVMYDDTLKSLPVRMYEDISHKMVRKKFGLVLQDNSPSFNTIIPEYYYRPADLIYTSSKRARANTFYLGELVILGDDCFSILKDKYIIIGNFSSEDHETYLEPIPGSLILWDTFLTLLKNKIRISISWLILLGCIYWIISFKIIMVPGKKLFTVDPRIKISFLREFIEKYLSYIGVLIIVDLISYLFFGTFVSLFYLATYLTVLELVLGKWKTGHGNLRNVWKSLWIQKA